MDFKYYRWSLLHIIGLALLLGGLAIALWLDYRTLAFVLCGLLALAFAALIRLYHHVFESIDLMFKAPHQRGLHLPPADTEPPQRLPTPSQRTIQRLQPARPSAQTNTTRT